MPTPKSKRRARRRATGRGYEYKKARQEWLKSLKSNEDIPRWIRKWIEREVREIDQGKKVRIKKGKNAGKLRRKRRIRIPPGYDCGHKKALGGGGSNTIDNFHIESSDMNRGRGHREKRYYRRKHRKRMLDALLRRIKCVR